ncbi:hypothetical protein [Bdellovibrio bacteriovorus]|uniref:Lysozyme inhibitor LprI N-terminal domain-containing protein n=1 Tax=Bdellovibrio bacteriovorus str. Tiberius TaxID=1069642 RepID=K7YYA0_BDEBC|nr:hypothetical protein [Bdellovibrio bacteriovorus]AFY02678.1 Hypothetical protein Bdt_3003 [Bdellovibrio bacteriovorus str. Tiberius]
MSKLNKWTLFTVTALLAWSNTSWSAESIDMNEPPFYMSSYDEFADLQQDQKDLYLQKLLTLKEKIPSLDYVNKEKLDEGSEWYATWDGMRKKLYNSCQEKELIPACEEFADLRIEVLNLHANQKEENRNATAAVQTAKTK